MFKETNIFKLKVVDNIHCKLLDTKQILIMLEKIFSKDILLWFKKKSLHIHCFLHKITLLNNYFFGIFEKSIQTILNKKYGEKDNLFKDWS